MKRKQFSEEQIIGILKEAEAGAVVTDLCRRHGMSSATYYAWKAKFGGLEVSDTKRLRVLEDGNVRLKRLLADTMLDNAGLIQASVPISVERGTLKAPTDRRLAGPTIQRGRNPFERFGIDHRRTTAVPAATLCRSTPSHYALILRECAKKGEQQFAVRRGRIRLLSERPECNTARLRPL
jgi:putative transposase